MILHTETWIKLDFERFVYNYFIDNFYFVNLKLWSVLRVDDD